MLLSSLALGQEASITPDSGEAVLRLDLCDNGDFGMPVWETAGVRFGTGIPWWVTTSGRPVLRGGGVHTANGSSLTQPFAAYAPLVSHPEFGLLLRGAVRGRGLLTFRDGSGAEARFEIDGGANGAFKPFELTAAQLEERVGKNLLPRFAVTLAAQPGEAATWDKLEFLVPFPDPDPDAFTLELVEAIDAIVSKWAERGMDTKGPRSSIFTTAIFDAITGEPVADAPAGVSVFFEALLDVAEAKALQGERFAPRAAAWQQLLDQHVTDFLDLSWSAETGVPRLWDPTLDEPMDERPIEAARYLRFLIDLAQRGPEFERERALAVAMRFGEAILDKGILPTGEVASRYTASDGQGDTLVPSIRELDMPTELVRLARLTGDTRYRNAALRALSKFEFLHMWGGTWDSIDPGLDDFYGHFGKRSIAMAEAFPEQEIWGRLSVSGLDYFEKPWRQTLEHGAFVAADQVRGWEGFAGVARAHPDRAAGVGELLALAVRAHIKGEMDFGGNWVGVSHHRWEPRFGLEVGDVPGAPVNLLHGLALVAQPGLGQDTRELRALFTAVLRTTLRAYGREYGLLGSRVEAEGVNPGGAEIRMMPALVLMLQRQG